MATPTRSPRPHRTAPRRAAGRAATVLAIALALAVPALGCASGDGRELRPPTAPPPSPTVPDESDRPVDLPTELPGEVPEPDIDPDIEPVADVAGFELFAAWRDGAPIDARHTCDGVDVSPALTWTGVPDGAVELALTVVDEQAAGLAHWIVTGIDPASVSALEGDVPPGAAEQVNSFDVAGWTGPCPPEGSFHTYRFTVHALDHRLAPDDGGDEGDEGSATVARIEAAAFESASMSGTYGR